MSTKRLPEICYAELPGTTELILIKRGERGYYKADFKGDPSVLNARIGVSDEDAERMLAGSMFGWDCPAAQPDFAFKRT